MPLLSLCIPTNGVVEWILPVLRSIYAQNVNEDDYEVVVSNNGDNLLLDGYLEEFKKHKNFRYYTSNSVLFDNCFECYAHSTGDFIKFINHRTVLLDGALQYLVNYVRDNKASRPVIYFSNGVLRQKNTIEYKNNFDEFVHDLGIYNSWGTGIGFWQEEIAEIKNKKVNSLFPDMTILYNRRKAEKYIIDNSVLLEEIQATHSQKGNYDLYFAFGVEFPALICELYRSGDITAKTFRYIAKENLFFMAGLYVEFNLLCRGHSYNVERLSDMFGFFYKRSDFVIAVIKALMTTVIKSAYRKIKRVRKSS